MRLLQLQLNGDESAALDLHPMMTVVSGLDRGTRSLLIEVLRSLPAGRDPGVAGLIESHGVLFDLSAETLKLLGMESDIDPLVQRSDLPGASPAADEPEEPLPVARLTTEQYLADTPEGVDAELDAARHRQRSARETLSILREASDRARREHTEAASRARLATSALTAATGSAEASSDAAGVRAAEGYAAVADRAELEAAFETLTAQLARVEQGLAELSGLDIRPIEVLLDAIRNPGPVEFVRSERASDLADEFEALQRKVDTLEARLESEGRGTATALARLEAARAELTGAERAMQKPTLSPADIVELEAAHEAVLEAESGMSGLRRRGGQKRFDEAQAREQVVLDRVGFPTWSSYVMGAGLLAIDPVAEQRLERARAEFSNAESHWAEVARQIEADPEHAALLDQLEAVYLEAFDVLGGDDQEDLAAALRAHQEPRREVTIDELVDALAYQLSLVGLDLGTPEPGVDRTLLAAEAFLAEVQGISDRVAELQQERDQVSADLADVRRSLERLDNEAHNRSTIDLTDAAAAADPEAVDLEALQAEYDQATEDESDYADQLEARLALVDAATRVEAVATSRLIRIAAQLVEADFAAASAAVPRPASDAAFEIAPDEMEGGPEAIEFYLLARLAAQRSVSFAGSVPLVIDDALADLDSADVSSLLGKLERMSESVQILYLSDSPTVIEWTATVGLNRAAVVTAGAEPRLRA